MSLRGLYNQLHEYRDQVGYWQNSANIYAGRLNEATAQLQHLQEQLAKAQDVLSKCNQLPAQEADLEGKVVMIASRLATCLDEPAATPAVQKIYENNGTHIQNSINACNALIADLESKIAEKNSYIAQTNADIAYSNNMAAKYQGYANSTQRSINNYHE